MTKNKSQIDMRKALKKLHQPHVYERYLNATDEEKKFLENIVHNILTKGYMPA